MKKYLSLIALIALTSTGLAHAHAHVRKSDPADNSTLSAAPKTLSLEFSEEAQVTALALYKGDTKVQDLELPKQASKQITAPLPVLGTGSYIIQWRVMSADKHIMSGKVSFKVQ